MTNLKEKAQQAKAHYKAANKAKNEILRDVIKDLPGTYWKEENVYGDKDRTEYMYVKEVTLGESPTITGTRFSNKKYELSRHVYLPTQDQLIGIYNFVGFAFDEQVPHKILDRLTQIDKEEFDNALRDIYLASMRNMGFKPESLHPIVTFTKSKKD